MLLSQTAEYALRAAAVLAAAWPDERLPARVLAERANVPPSYASKVLRRLVVADLVDSRKGHHGGFRLLDPPDRITLLRVLQAVDAVPIPGKCAFGFGQCHPDEPCPLHEAWTGFNDSFLAWACSNTLAGPHAVD